MSISALLNPTLPSASYLNIYCNSITTNENITHPNYFIECTNSIQQGLPGSSGFPRNFDTIINQSNFPAPIANLQFQPTKSGYYKVSFTISFTNTAVLLSGTKFEAFITKNGGAIYYEPSVITTDLAVSGVLSLTSSYIIFFNGSTDYIECIASHSAPAIVVIQTGSGLVDLLKNKITIHYLHD